MMTKEEFINQIAQYAIKYAPKYGIAVVSPIIAQACKESAFGTSNKAKYHNYFGLKYRENRVSCSSGYFVDVSSEQNPDGSYVNITDKWFKFDSMEAGVEGYFQFINIANYKALKGVTDPLTYLTKLKEAGYATSLTYVNSCMNDYITKYNLTKYDNELKGGNKTMFKVVIDSGHGSNTAGKRHPDGYKEHYSNTYVSFYLDQILRKNDIETLKVSWDDKDATDDSDVALTTRQDQIKNAGCDIVVSIHANAFGDGKTYNSAQGVETLYHSNNAVINDSARLATLIQKELIKGTSQDDRGVKRSNLAMCNATRMNVKAAVLVELAFMTNKRESDLLKDEAFLIENAKEIAQGIFNYLGVSGNVNVALESAFNNSVKPVDPEPEKPSTPVKPETPATGVNFKTGDSLSLKNVNLYASSNATTGTKRTGTYYIWSTEVINNRVRVTNAKNRVGVSGQVSGWVNVNDLGANSGSNNTVTPPANNTPSNNISKGQKLNLKAVTVYASSNATSGSKKSGIYYIWSDEVVNGKIRITNSKERVGVTGQVTGWININSIIVNNTFHTGDKIVLNNTPIFSSSTTAAGSAKSGTYYIWNNQVVNNRIRITNTKNRVGIAGQITGWVNIKDI